MLKIRIVTGVILGCLLLLGLFELPPRGAVLAFGALLTLGAWEWAGFGGLRSYATRAAYAAGIGVLLYITWAWTWDIDHFMGVLVAACAWWVGAFLWLTLAPGVGSRRLALLCGVPVLVPAFLALSRVQVASGAAQGPDMVLWLILLVVAADVGAYFAGRSLGRHKLIPRVSPGKTWEGAIGGLGAVALVSLMGALHFGYSLVVTVLFGCAVGIFSVVGDLTESMFKRASGLKDSGSLLPGHGGLLDRLDSVTAAAPLYAIGLFHAGVIK